ncbi:MAG: hypothetical protein IJW63_00885 [Lachnospiraceae bacterium]|nr:hypothetical protein [Lachnospiraceae bacterium]
MNQQPISVEKSTFESKLIPISTVSFAIAAIFGVLAVGYLFHPSSISAIIKDLIVAEIYDLSAQQTWLFIYIALTVVNCLGTLLLSVGFVLLLMKRYKMGMDLMFHSAKWALTFVNISGAITLAYFIFRSIRYIFVCCQTPNDAAFLLISFVLMEGLMVTQAVFLFIKLRQFLSGCMEATAGIGYTLCYGKITSPSIPPVFVLGFLTLGIFDIGIAWDRFFTFIHIQVQTKVIYKFPLTTDPFQFISGLSFAFAALGNILLYFYLRGYKRKSERILIQSFKNITQRAPSANTAVNE